MRNTDMTRHICSGRMFDYSCVQSRSAISAKYIVIQNVAETR